MGKPQEASAGGPLGAAKGVPATTRRLGARYCVHGFNVTQGVLPIREWQITAMTRNRVVYATGCAYGTFCASGTDNRAIVSTSTQEGCLAVFASGCP